MNNVVLISISKREDQRYVLAYNTEAGEQVNTFDNLLQLLAHVALLGF